jgi:hypothetical protein
MGAGIGKAGDEVAGSVGGGASMETVLACTVTEGGEPDALALIALVGAVVAALKAGEVNAPGSWLSLTTVVVVVDVVVGVVVAAGVVVVAFQVALPVEAALLAVAVGVAVVIAAALLLAAVSAVADEDGVTRMSIHSFCANAMRPSADCTRK